MRGLIAAVIIIILLPCFSFAQVSYGGHPRAIPQLKSAKIPVLNMPSINQEQLKSASFKEEDTFLKPFKFAHRFEVDLSVKNSGEWFNSGDGIRCWNLTIKSEGAKTLNLILDDFELPEEAKLFVFNRKENHFLGAFTNQNNKGSKKFAISPVKGEEITIQYEVPYEKSDKVPFVIESVNHDFVGILGRFDRRPLGQMAGDCNIDINCDIGDEWSEIKNSVCRIIVNGGELCSGILINNTSEDETPYILSAAHCYNRWEHANTSVYVFNYESPYCAPLDGDPSNSISGAIMRAKFDSLDFALAELTIVPPPDYRPYYAGWERSSEIPDYTVSIHHPQGDIKKIAIDNDPPTISSFNANKKYTTNGFLKVARWETGVTEIGSSGGPLFNQDKRLVGTLTGGLATCSNPINDYFHRFALSWDYKSDSLKQLKYWLDPLKSNAEIVDGNRFYVEENLCAAITNLNDDDEHALVKLVQSDNFQGYWGGSNDVGITEFVERYSVEGNEELAGISLGVGKVVAGFNSNSRIDIKVYNGTTVPENEIYTKSVMIKELAPDAMNYIGFSESVAPSDTFFVGYNIHDISAQDTFAVYQSLRGPNTENAFYFKQGNTWYNFKESNSGFNSMVNVFELVACNVGSMTDTPIVNAENKIHIFPNPTSEKIELQTIFPITREDVSVINLIGQTVHYSVTSIDANSVQIDLNGNVPGVYFVRLKSEEGIFAEKISYVPW